MEKISNYNLVDNLVSDHEFSIAYSTHLAAVAKRNDRSTTGKCVLASRHLFFERTVRDRETL